MTTIQRRCACVLALVLLFLTTGVVSMPNLGAQGLEFRVASNPAKAETLTDKGGYSEELLSVNTRHKTH